VELEVHTEIGRGGKIVDFPALANIVIDKLKRKLIKTMVLPAMDDYQFFKEEDGGDPSTSSSTSPSGLNTSPSSLPPSPITSENNSPTNHSYSTPSELEGKGGYQTGSSNSFTSLPTPEGIYEHLVTSSTSSPNLDGGRRARSRSLTLDQSTALSATSLEGTQEEMIVGGSEGGREARSFSSIPNPKPLPAQDPSPVHHSYRGEKNSSPASLGGSSSPPFSSSPPAGEEKSLLTSLWRNFTKKD
jgi:hypothetical protein